MELLSTIFASAGELLVFVVMVGVYFIAQRLCLFSSAQALFLTAFAYIPLEVSRRWFLKRRFWTPFELSMSVDYLNVLMDAGVIRDSDEWKTLMHANGYESGSDFPWDVTASVLAYDFDRRAHLVWWRDLNRYTQSVERPLIRLDINSLPIASAYPVGRKYSPLNVTLGLVMGVYGLQLVMDVDTAWWNARWAQTEENSRPSFTQRWSLHEDTTKLTIAIFPSAELQWRYCWTPKLKTISLAQRNAMLTTFGWKQTHEPYWEINSTSYGIEHRYLTVTHQPIQRFDFL